MAGQYPGSALIEVGAGASYSLYRWPALIRYADDGRTEINKNAAEREIRPVAYGRKIWLFSGSDAGGERAAALYSLIGSASSPVGATFCSA